jgi:hypothetical protein
MTPFATFWHGPLGAVAYSCLASFPAFGAALTVYTYIDGLEVPKGVEVADARAIVADETELHRYLAGGKPSLATFSDRFRYSLLGQSDVCWVDADMLCLATPDFGDEAIVWGLQPEAHGKALINNAVMKLPRDHVVLAEMLSRARAAIDVDLSWGAIGPFLLTEVAERHGVYPTARAPKAFYPVGPDDFWRLLLPAYRESVERDVVGATFLHLWSELFRRCGYETSACPPDGSYLHGAFARLGTLGRFARIYGEADMMALLSGWIR